MQDSVVFFLSGLIWLVSESDQRISHGNAKTAFSSMMLFVLLPLKVFLKELPVPKENPLLVLLFSENCIFEGQFFSCVFCQFFSA